MSRNTKLIIQMKNILHDDQISNSVKVDNINSFFKAFKTSNRTISDLIESKVPSFKDEKYYFEDKPVFNLKAEWYTAKYRYRLNANPEYLNKKFEIVISILDEVILILEKESNCSE